MGCGSSKSAVAVANANSHSPLTKEVNVNNFAAKKTSEEITQSTDNLKNTKALPDINNSVKNVKSAFIEDVLNGKVNAERAFLGSRTSLNGNKMEINDSNLTRDKSATSMKSKDSGVFDERNSKISVVDEVERNNSGRTHSLISEKNVSGDVKSGGSATSLHSKREDSARSRSVSARIDSGTSQSSAPDSISGKPPSGKKSSARKKLLRIHDDLYDSELNVPISDPPLEIAGQNIMLRPKSRFGNVAFDIVLDTPETGNTKKRPDKLPSLSTKHKKTKKVKTKKDIDKKMEDAAARRKIQEGEKLLKAKQFQHFPIITPVETFHPDEDDDQVEKVTTPVQRLSINNVYNRVSETETNNYNNNIKDQEKETIVESFHIESDDEDAYDDNLFPDRASLPALVAY